jgi:hypothetical protein
MKEVGKQANALAAIFLSSGWSFTKQTFSRTYKSPASMNIFSRIA